MRKVILSMMVSLDGFIEGPGSDLDWHRVDEDFNEYAVGLLHTVDTILFGRVTYQMFEGYWPGAATDLAISESDRKIAHLINDAEKVVFSRTLENVSWRNSRLVTGDVGQEIARLKERPGKDMVVYGGATLAQSLMQRGLFDDYRLFVNPIVLGAGKPLFGAHEDRFALQLLETRTFATGVVLLHYQTGT
ncbi:MAG: dihydrofolate reductase family protein [Chloroflexota bacterium]